MAVCHNRRINRHRVFRDLAARGKNSMDWFYGFKLHLVVSDTGELLAACVTPGNVGDRRPVDALTHDLFGKLFGDIAAPLGAGLVTPMLRLHLASAVRDPVRTWS